MNGHDWEKALNNNGWLGRQLPRQRKTFHGIGSTEGVCGGNCLSIL